MLTSGFIFVQHLHGFLTLSPPPPPKKKRRNFFFLRNIKIQEIFSIFLLEDERAAGVKYQLWLSYLTISATTTHHHHLSNNDPVRIWS